VTAGHRVPVPAAGTCRVWWAGPQDVRPEHDALLAGDDLARRARLHLPADRLRLTAAWAVARLVLGAAADVPPDLLEVDRTCPECGAQHGKPRLPAAPDLHFSLAHSGGCVVVAVAAGTPVGVDVESVGALAEAELDALADSTLAGEERAALDSCPHRARAFTTWWTRKESVLKATGDGLAVPLDELVLSPPCAPPRVLRWPAASRARALSMHVLHPPAAHVATLTVLGAGPCRVVEADAAPLLRSAPA
jgi:4'-phosphopantetheinyl transferase